jgi:hypothetical protein
MQTIKIEMYNFGGGFGGFFDSDYVVEREFAAIESAGELSTEELQYLANNIWLTPEYENRVAECALSVFENDLKELFPESFISAEIDRIGYNLGSIEVNVQVTNLDTFWAELATAVALYVPSQQLSDCQYFGHDILHTTHGREWASELAGKVYDPELLAMVSKAIAHVQLWQLYGGFDEFDIAVLDKCSNCAAMEVVGTTAEANEMLNRVFNPTMK